MFDNNNEVEDADNDDSDDDSVDGNSLHDNAFSEIKTSSHYLYVNSDKNIDCVVDDADKKNAFNGLTLS